MEEPPLLLAPEVSVEQARSALERSRAEYVVIRGRDGATGVMTARQLRDELAHHADDAPLSRVVTLPVMAVAASAALPEAATIMVRAHARALPVADAGRIVGVVTADALAELASAEVAAARRWAARRRLLVRWLLACVTGQLAGVVVEPLVSGHGSSVELLGLLAGGVVTGVLQARVLASRIALRAGSWVLLTAAGLVAGWALGFALELPGPVANGAVTGVLIASAQWRVLRRHVGPGAHWVVASGLGGAAAAWAAALVGTRGAAAFLGAASGAALAGFITGFELVRMLELPGARLPGTGAPPAGGRRAVAVARRAATRAGA